MRKGAQEIRREGKAVAANLMVWFSESHPSARLGLSLNDDEIMTKYRGLLYSAQI